MVIRLILGLALSMGSIEAALNIVYILADDLGYGDLGCYGSTLNDTPHIDALAASGLRLTDFHAASWCAPSRRALMTGCHANRPWNTEEGKWGRLAAATTLPEMLKSQGYATALLGKWHLELGEGLHPLDQGFDFWFGTKGSNDWDGPKPNASSFRDSPEEAWKTPLHINRENQGPVVQQSEFTRRYTEEAVRWIHEQGKEPFFLYVAHNMPHVPIFASKRFRGKSRNGVYGDVMAEIDWSVGEIIKTLKANGLFENTLVVFTSDNGPWSMFKEFGGVAHPLRGEKSTTWEGGERVPCIVSWPGSIPQGVCEEFMTNYDVYATLACLTGAEILSGQAMDSLDMSKVLLSGAPSSRTKHVYFHHQPMAYRSGDYKLHLATRERTRDPESGKQEPSVTHEPGLLFDLKKDPSESQNIAAEHPELVQRLTKEFEEAQSALKEWTPF
ncbi:MAG: arylsulfatase A [Verrucomicrobiales bacterium]|jgi:arylsulfatase A-like enzyme